MRPESRQNAVQRRRGDDLQLGHSNGAKRTWYVTSFLSVMLIFSKRSMPAFGELI